MSETDKTAQRILAINSLWLETMMVDYDLRQVDLVRECGINKMQLSQFLTGKKDLPPSRKFTLFYFFKTLAMERQIRMMKEGNDFEY